MKTNGASGREPGEKSEFWQEMLDRIRLAPQPPAGMIRLSGPLERDSIVAQTIAGGAKIRKLGAMKVGF